MKRQATLPFQPQPQSAEAPLRGMHDQDEDRLVKRKRIATFLGVPWPPSKATRRRGRPSRPEAWISALEGALLREAWAQLSSLPENCAHAPPAWFTGGSCISTPGTQATAIQEADAVLSQVRASFSLVQDEHAVEPETKDEKNIEAAEDGDGLDAHKTRPKSIIPWETKRWFVAWSLAMQRKQVDHLS